MAGLEYGRTDLADEPSDRPGQTRVLAIAVIPGLAINLPQATTLRGELPAPFFWILSVELQNPQHMLPHLWRMPQWLSWFSYLSLAVLPLVSSRPRPTDEPKPPAGIEELGAESAGSRGRLAIMMVVIAIGLTAAWSAIELMHNIRATVFQPFRMSTVIRGIALVFISGRLVRLWRAGRRLDRTRATVLATAFLGDWLLVVATIAELVVSTFEAIRLKAGHVFLLRAAPAVAYIATIGLGLYFLAHHDTESGHIPLLIAIALGLAMEVGSWRDGALASLWVPTPTRRARRLAVAAVVALDRAVWRACSRR